MGTGNTHKTYFLPCILIMLTGFLSFAYVYPGHPLVYDTFLYLRQAQSILTGDAYQVYNDMQEMLSRATYKMYSPTLYPWGVPLIFSPVYALFGLDFYPYKFFQWLLFNSGVLFFFFYLKRNENFVWQAFLIALIIGIQPLYYAYISLILSEIPFFFSLMLCFYWVQYIYRDKPLTNRYIPYYILTGVFMLWSSQVRTEGLLLFPAFGGALLLRLFWEFREERNVGKIRKKIILSLIPFGTALILYLFISLFLPAGYLRHIDHTAFTTTEVIRHNLVTYFEELGRFFPFKGMIGISFLLLISVAGMIYRFKTHFFELLFLIFLIVLLIYWPHYNIRHLLALLPLLLFFFISGLKWIIPYSWKGVTISHVIAVVIFISVIPRTVTNSSYKYHTSGQLSKKYNASSPNYLELIDVVKQTVPKGDHIAFAYCRALYLYTGYLSFPAFGTIEDTLNNAEWYIYCKDNDNYIQYSISKIKSYGSCFEKVYENREYIFYRLNKEKFDLP